MISKPSISKPPINIQEALPLNAQIRGGLRDRIRQFSDGVSNILVPKNPVTTERTIVTPPGAAGNIPTPPPPVCIPADLEGQFIDPADNPLNLGDSYTVAAFLPSGTAPLFYTWFIADGPSGTGTTINFTLTDGMITGKDGSGLGHITVTVIIRNACNTDGASNTGTYPAQGMPP